MTSRRKLDKGVHVFIRSTSDVDWARRTVRELSAHEGLSEPRAAALATAVTEIARNIVVHAGKGDMFFVRVTDGLRRGIVVVARDIGPGIRDIARAMEDGYSTKGSLGLGLAGAKCLVDEFEIESALGAGVTVKLTQWDENNQSCE
jgi:serine/threonine-protein kinase RsbT